MSWWKFGSSPAAENDLATVERRKEPRIGGRFKIRYSGVHEDRIIMGHATIVDLSRYGFGLKGGRGLKQGMRLTFFFEMSHMDMTESLCIPEACIMWVQGSRFGVHLSEEWSKEPVWIERLTA